ncbi:hypothetical protein D9Q98_002400 [Chlorella vulgaris]|uniref:polynucleotide adenylyltransferase n=1 Tax=Chlorella vulgaris TaxID=3077 RepID=A0A9D4TWG0_CHLVU|nr:hypothetical protein D9Q98_002400 [Chlorella vulgaris]
MLSAVAQEQLVAVFDEPGAVTFSYQRAGCIGLGGAANGGGNGGYLLPAGPQQAQMQAVVEPAIPPALERQLDEFISFDIVPVAAKEPPQQPAGAPGVVGSLLDDYVLQGILDDPAKVKAAAAAKAAARSSRPELLKRVPWLASLNGIRSPLLRLHQEIVEFCRYLAPSPEEQVQRQAAIDRIEGVVKAIWPKASLQVFGSFATGLYLPTSDVDAVVMGSGCTDIPQGLKALATSLARKNMAKNMQVIARAKVPIVKFEDAETGYNFDVSFDVANGPEAAENVRALMDALPPMRPLVMVLKVFLQQRELNEVYSGGLGSYALLVMVASFIQLHPSRQQPATTHRYGSGKDQREESPGELEGSLGVLLLDFLRLFGRALNNVEVGVSCRKGGSYFNKRNKGFYSSERPYLFAVEDPNDPSNDLGRNSYNISRVRMAFDWAYCQLSAPVEEGASLLQRVIRLDPVLFLRAPPPPLDDSPSPPPDLSKKKSKKKKDKQRREEGSTEQPSEEREKPPKRKKAEKVEKRRHRERSLSDEDGEIAGSGSSGERWQLEEEEDVVVVQPAPVVEEDRRHKKHKHSHKHHQRHSRGGSAEDAPAQRSRERWQPRQQAGSNSRHVYFD